MNTIRFSGLASGLDTQSIVDSMMRVERLPLDRLKQKKQVVEWQRDKFRDMNKLLKEFDTFIFDGIFRQNNMLKRAVTSSNSDVVSAVANSSAGNVSYKVENVTLATAARIQSSNTISKTETSKIDPSKSIWSQREKFSTGISWSLASTATKESFTVPSGGGQELRLAKEGIDASAQSEVVVRDENGDVAGNYEVVFGAIPEQRDSDKVYIDDTGKVVFGTRLNEGHKFDIEYRPYLIEFNIETYNEDGTSNTKQTNFKFDSFTSLNTVFNEINKSNVGVNIFYDNGADRVVAQRKATGDLSKDGQTIKFLGPNNSFFTDVLKLDQETAGTDARFTINGLETSRKSNTFTMNDVTFTLKKNSAESVSININVDTEGIFSTVKSFIDKYNELISKINGEITAERFSTFLPLTDEQRQTMKEKEIEQWEEKAKSGLLRRDVLLSSGLSKMRMDLYTEVKSNEITRTVDKYNQLSEIGIKTTKDYLDRGKLEIDEAKLKAAIEDNPEAVYQLFMADGPTYQEKGLARRLRSSIEDTLKKVEEKAGNTFKTEHNYSMGKDLVRMKSSIDSLEDRLKIKEKRYWDQYTSMEKAMQRMNDQSSQLMAQLGAMMQSK